MYIKNINKKITFCKKIFFYFVLIALIILGIKARIGIEVVPYDWSDRYFSTTISFLQKHTFDFDTRPPYFQLFALASVLLFKSFSGIVYIQLFLGLVTCLIFLLFYIKVFDFLKTNYIVKDLCYLSGLGLFYLLYCSNQKIEFEFAFRPENMSLLFESILLLLLFYLFKKPKNKIVKIFFFFFNFLLIYISFKFSFICLFNIFVFSIFYIFKEKQKILNIFLYLIIPFLVMFMINNLIISKSTNGSKDYLTHKHRFDSGLLFWRNIGIIKEDIYTDIHKENFIKFDKEKMQTVLNYYDNFPKEYNSYLDSNIYDVDQFLYSEKRFKTESISNDVDYTKNFYSYYIYKSFVKHPGAYIKKYLYEMYLLYKFDFHTSYTYVSYSIDYKKYALYTLGQISDSVDINSPIAYDCYNKLLFGSNNNKIIDNNLNDKIFNILGIIYAPLWFIFISIFVFFKSKKDTYGKIACLVSVYAFLMASVSAATYYLIYERYIFEIFPLLLISELMMMIYIPIKCTKLILLNKNMTMPNFRN